MTHRALAAALLLSLPVSSLLVACGGVDEDSTAQRAIENEALERDLDLALRVDSAPAPRLADVPVADVPVTDAPEPELPAFTPPPAPRREAPAVRRREPVRQPERVEPEPAPEPARPAEPEAPRHVTRTAQAGQTFSVRIEEEISAKQDGAGSTFSATLADGLTDELGRVVIPAGATVTGRVVSTEGGQIALDFSSIEYAGERYSISSSVVTAPAVRRVNRTGGGETAAKVVGGAAVGAVIGRVLGGDRRSAAAGAAVGAAAGTAGAIATANVDRVIDAGSTATVRLDGPVTVRQEL